MLSSFPLWWKADLGGIVTFSFVLELWTCKELWPWRIHHPKDWFTSFLCSLTKWSTRQDSITGKSKKTSQRLLSWQAWKIISAFASIKGKQRGRGSGEFFLNEANSWLYRTPYDFVAYIGLGWKVSVNNPPSPKHISFNYVTQPSMTMGNNLFHLLHRYKSGLQETEVKYYIYCAATKLNKIVSRQRHSRLGSRLLNMTLACHTCLP